MKLEVVQGVPNIFQWGHAADLLMNSQQVTDLFAGFCVGVLGLAALGLTVAVISSFAKDRGKYPPDLFFDDRKKHHGRKRGFRN